MTTSTGEDSSSVVEGLTIANGYGDYGGGIVKAFFFGVIVAGIGCMKGLQTGSGASAVGESTTKAVVSAIVLIAVVDCIFAIVYYFLGV